MTDEIRQAFTKNAEEFDALVVELLDENDKLTLDAARYRWFREHTGQLVITTEYAGDLQYITGLELNDSLADIAAESVDDAVDVVMKESMLRKIANGVG